MKKLLFICFGFFLFSCSDEWESLQHDKAPPSLLSDLSVPAARTFFEEHATDLSPLSLGDPVKTRGNRLLRVDLVPEWKGALTSSKDEVSVVEIPLQSNTLLALREGMFEKGKLKYTKFWESFRRLIIVRQKSGAIEMFM